MSTLRTIKFRGYNKAKKAWLYGNLLTAFDGSKYIVPNALLEAWEYKTFQAIPETVGQWTGSVDNNGREVYEGDIVTYQEEDRYMPTLELIYRSNERQCFDGDWSYYYDAKVIGNKFESPKLMTEIRYQYSGIRVHDTI